jgi:hypothetical protein
LGKSGLDDVILGNVEDDSSHGTSGSKTNNTPTPLFVKELGDRGRKTVLDRLTHGSGGANRDNEGGELLIGEVEGVLLLGLGRSFEASYPASWVHRSSLGGPS